MTSEVSERRQCRRAAQQVFDELAVDYLGWPAVSRATMFGSEGLRVETKFFAFVGGDGQLIVKLPAAQAAALVSAGEASPVRAGRSVTREWVGVPRLDVPRGGDREAVRRWRDLISDAYRYVASLTS